MTAEDRIEVRLQLDRTGDRLTGEVRDDATASAFEGWLALVAALEAARLRAAATRSDRGQTDNPSEVDGDRALENRKGSDDHQD